MCRCRPRNAPSGTSSRIAVLRVVPAARTMNDQRRSSRAVRKARSFLPTAVSRHVNFTFVDHKGFRSNGPSGNASRVRTSYSAAISAPILFVADRFLLNAPTNHALFQRNGNPLDLRLSNSASVPRRLLLQAQIEESRGPNYGAYVTLRDGRMRSCRKPLRPTAVERIAAIMNPQGRQPHVIVDCLLD
jgi:hypothetical protein